MSYQASIHDLTTGRFLLRFLVEAQNLHEAEKEAITKGALTMKAHPREIEVRRLHECASHPVEETLCEASMRGSVA